MSVAGSPPMPPALPPVFSYPVVPAATVHAAAHKLPPRRLVIIAAAALVIVVVIITAVVVLARPGSISRCTFACGAPRLGPALISTNAYHNTKWNYSVDYSTDTFGVGTTDDDSVTLQGQQGLPLIKVQAMQSTDAGEAVQSAITNLDSSTYQSQQPGGSIPGSEVGEVQGAGQSLTATYVQLNGIPVAINVYAATQNSVTLVVTIVDQQSQSNKVSGISHWDDAFVLSEVRWPGS